MNLEELLRKAEIFGTESGVVSEASDKSQELDRGTLDSVGLLKGAGKLVPGLGEDGPKRWEPHEAMREAESYKNMKGMNKARDSEKNKGDKVDSKGDKSLNKLMDTLRKGKKEKKKDKK